MEHGGSGRRQELERDFQIGAVARQRDRDFAVGLGAARRCGGRCVAVRGRFGGGRSWRHSIWRGSTWRRNIWRGRACRQLGLCRRGGSSGVGRRCSGGQIIWRGRCESRLVRRRLRSRGWRLRSLLVRLLRHGVSRRLVDRLCRRRGGGLRGLRSRSGRRWFRRTLLVGLNSLHWLCRRRGRRRRRSGGGRRVRVLRQGYGRGVLPRLGVRIDDIDHITAVVAEGADFRFAGEAEAQRCRLLVRLRLDRAHRRRQRRHRLAEIELDRRLECQRHRLVTALDRDRDLLRHIEHVTGKRRLGGDVNVHRRKLLQRHQPALALGKFFGIAGAARQGFDHVLRQSGRQPLPSVGQQIDEIFFAGAHGVDRHRALERKPHRLAVRIAPGTADVIGQLGGEPLDRHVDRRLETDDQHIAGLPDMRLVVLAHVEDEAGVTAGVACAQIGPDRIGESRA